MSNDKVRKLNVLEHKERMLLEDFWLKDWHGSTSDVEPGATAQRWYRAVLHLINRRGDEVLPNHVLKNEARILELGLADEYLTNLREAVNSQAHRSETEHAVILLMATPEQRNTACFNTLKGRK